MLDNNTIAVVVPARNEAALIDQTLSTMPDFVDHLIVIDDASTDNTEQIVRQREKLCRTQQDEERDEQLCRPRIRVIRHSVNRGVGAAIATGYREALRSGADVVAVMAGDGQMDPADLDSVVRPVIAGDFDYVKGVRLHHREASRMPAVRRLGTRFFGWATGLAIGQRALADSQCGYTAISSRAIDKLDLDALWPGYGYPNDLLCQLRVRGLRIGQVTVRPVYGTEKSGLRPHHALVIAFLVARSAWRVHTNESRC